MLEMALTTECCKQIVVDILKRPSWSLHRMARTIGLPEGYVRNVQAGLQSFQLADVDALAKACGTKAYELVLNTFKDDLATRDSGFYELAMKQIDLHREMEKILADKPARKSRSQRSTRSTARAAKTSPKPAARRVAART
jgi:hypothetical protein